MAPQTHTIASIAQGGLCFWDDIEKEGHTLLRLENRMAVSRSLISGFDVSPWHLRIRRQVTIPQFCLA